MPVYLRYIPAIVKSVFGYYVSKICYIVSSVSTNVKFYYANKSSFIVRM